MSSQIAATIAAWHIGEEIRVGRHVGWGKMQPADPDPYFRIASKQIRVAAWNVDAASADIGMEKVEWVLFTHHHREQCQGFSRLERLRKEKEWSTQYTCRPDVVHLVDRRPIV